jgi:tryptophan synthase alpha subunit
MEIARIVECILFFYILYNKFIMYIVYMYYRCIFSSIIGRFVERSYGIGALVVLDLGLEVMVSGVLVVLGLWKEVMVSGS